MILKTIQNSVLLVVFSLLVYSSTSLSSRITFEYGLYQNILVAINPDTDPLACKELVRNITEAFQSAGSYLYNSTNQRSNFGTIKLLIPWNWGSDFGSTCDIPIADIHPSKQFEIYDNADFRITMNHPFTTRLPWTKQFKECENESESVLIPVEFLTNPELNANFRGRLLLHEWGKLRYGVFEEIGYFNDPIYSPCYVSQGKIYYTGCTDVEMIPLKNSTEEISTEECRSLLQEHRLRLVEQLKTANSSIMFSPHIENINQFCTPNSNVGISPTKQNLLCERKSVADVIFSHKDFKQTTEQENSIFPNTRRRTKQIVFKSPVVELIRRDTNYDQGYAFVIEHDTTIRESGRLLQIKQAMAMILKQAKSSSHICVTRFEESVYGSTCDVDKLETDDQRIRLLNQVPGPETIGLIEQLERRGRSRFALGRSAGNNAKRNALFQIIDALGKYPLVHWNVIVISSSTPGNLPEEINKKIEATGYTLSIFTLDSSREWLGFYKSANFHKLIYAPKCEETNCKDMTVPLFVNNFNDLVRTNSSSQKVFMQKVIDFTFVAGDDAEFEQSFTITSTEFVKNLNNFQLFMAVNKPENTDITLSSGLQTCKLINVLNYANVLSFDTTDCPYLPGTWTLRVSSNNGFIDQSYFYLLGYGEVLESLSSVSSNLKIDASLGKELSTPVFPTVNSLPVYVSVTNAVEKPILHATVELVMYYDNIPSSELSQPYAIRDNGIYPDLTQNDGIYSGFIMKFNSASSYHTGQISVRTVAGQSKSITSVSTSNGAALLDPDNKNVNIMESKCCGSSIPVNRMDDVDSSSYAINLPSFFTGESYNQSADIFPPAKISSAIRIFASTTAEVQLKFTAPGSDHNSGPPLAYYDICCSNSSSGNLNEKMCSNIRTEECLPVGAGEEQNCLISKISLAEEFYNSSSASGEFFLYCSLRGVDSSGNIGPLSSTLLEVTLNLEDIRKAASSVCKSLSDDCLPVEVFWGLIACIGGLICLLFIVLLCWCCLKDKKTRSVRLQPDGRHKLESKDRDDSDPNRSLQNVYINQAYIQDTNGQLRLIASDGELLSLSNVNNDFEMKLAAARRSRSKSSSPFPTEPASEVDVGGLRKQIAFENPRPNIQNQSSTFTLPQQRPASTFSNNTAYRTPIIRKSGESLENSPQIQPANSRVHIPRLSPVPTISGTIINDHPDPGQETLNPIYASVNRAPRRSPSPNRAKTHYLRPNFSNSISTSAQNLNSPVHTDTTNIPQRPQSASDSPTKPHTHSSVTNFATNPRQINSLPLPPVRLDHFPSSESEIYSDMSLILKQPDKSKMQFPMSHPVPDRPRNLPAEIKKSMEIQRPRVNPPPPPPRQSRSPPVPPTFRQPAVEDDEYDDDSDYWDNFDDIEEEENRRNINRNMNSPNSQINFNYKPPGASFA